MQNEATLRLIVFIGVLVVMGMFEALFARKKRNQARSQRWLTNFGLTLANTLILRLLGPITAIGVADLALDNGWGLFAKLPFAMPFYLEVVLGVVFLDIAIYLQHRAMHKVPILWRVHRVHHTDRDIDVTTALRFHPIEAVLSMVYKCVIILLLGPITFAVMLFEIILNASAMFNHSNLKLPLFIDRLLRSLIITPDMHRVHHSVVVHETNSNYGFFLSIWDRIFKTHCPQPKHGHDLMTIGLDEHQTEQPASFLWAISLPFIHSKVKQ